MPRNIKIILNLLNENSFEAYLIGGCVRDMLLRRIPKDYDIATNAVPEQVIDIFKKNNFKTIPTGIKHGTVTIVIDDSNYEITTYRIESDYTDLRRPDFVNFTTNLCDDVSRRDFTINSLAFNPTEGIIDFFNGQKHLNERCIKCIGDSNKRFSEDPLRMLRAVRLSSELNFKIEEETLKGIEKNKVLITKVSNERKQQELIKLLISDFPEVGLKYSSSTNLLFYIIPEFSDCKGFEQNNKHHDKDVLNHTIEVIKNTPKDLEIRLTALFHDIGKPLSYQNYDGKYSFKGHSNISADLTKKILTRLKFNSKTIENVVLMVKYHEIQDELSKSNIKKLLNKLGTKDQAITLFRKLLLFRIGDIKGQSSYMQKEKLLFIQKTKSNFNEILKYDEAFKISDLKINGNDLLKLGFKDKDIGIILNELLTLVIEQKIINSKDQLLKYLSSKVSI